MATQDQPLDRTIPVKKLSFDMLQGVGARFIGREYIWGGHNISPICFTRYFSADFKEVAYRSDSGIDVVFIFGNARLWGVPLPQLRPLSETNWDC